MTDCEIVDGAGSGAGDAGDGGGTGGVGSEKLSEEQR